MFQSILQYLADGQNWAGPDGIPIRIAEHLFYSVIALAIAFVIAFPIGLLIGHTGRGALLAINIGNAGRALPTLGLLVLLYLLTSADLVPAIAALVILAIPPLLTSTYAAIRTVEPGVVDAARGMGMKESQILFQAELPAALPVIVGGLRTAALQVVSTATVAAYIGLGGLGRMLFDGLKQFNYPEMLVGAVLVAILAIVLDVGFVGLKYVAAPGGFAARRKTPTRRQATAA